MCRPWVLHFYPGLTPDKMEQISLSLYVAMFDGLPD